MKKAIIILLAVILFFSCVSTSTNVNLSPDKSYKFYISATENDPLNIYPVIQTEIEKRSYEVYRVLPNSSTGSNNESLESSGSGFFISKDIIITCAHIITNTKDLIVNIDGKGYQVQILQSNVSTDLAVLRIIGYESPYFFNVSSFNNEELGNKIYALGYPLSNILGADIRITDGIISAKSGIEANPTYFQISASIQPGNSGGPIINEKFSVIGITSSKLSEVATLQATGTLSQNVNFGVKSDYLILMANAYLNQSNVIRSISDALKATVYIIANQSNNQNNQNNNPSENIIVSITYTYYWDVVHWVITNLRIDFIDPKNGLVVGTGTHSGDTLSGAETTARKIINQMLDKIK
jgi:S1-C subfamily serine protease